MCSSKNNFKERTKSVLTKVMISTSSLQACAHAFFDDLRNPATTLPNGAPLPPLFNFTEQELAIQPNLNALLLPKRPSAAGEDNAPAPSPATEAPTGDMEPATSSEMQADATDYTQ